MNSKLIRIIVFVMLAMGIAFVVINRESIDIKSLQDWIKNAGSAAPLLFMLLYIIATVFFLPGSVLTLFGGALFGPVLGTLYNLTGATIGAMLAFLIARFIASNWVSDKAGVRLKKLMNGVDNEGWRFVAFTRLVPLFPFNLLNYALGLTKIPFTHYSLATYICMLPGTFAYSYLGYAGKEAISGGEDIVQKVMLAIALLAIASFLPRLINKLRAS